MRDFLFDPSSHQNLSHRQAEVVTEKQVRDKVYQIVSRLPDESVLVVFEKNYGLDFRIRITALPCRFEVVPWHYRDVLETDDSYPSPLPSKLVWSKDEIARVISEFPMDQEALSLVYNALFCSDLRDSYYNEDHSFVVPLKGGDFALIYIHDHSEKSADHQEKIAFPKWPTTEQIEKILHEVTLAGWRMPAGWTLKRTGGKHG